MPTLKSLVDETSNIKNELVNCYDNLKTNLIAKDVEVLPTDKILNLINKVGNMELGKKWATQDITIQIGDGDNTSSINTSYTLNANFGFTPSIVFLEFPKIVPGHSSWNLPIYNCIMSSTQQFRYANKFQLNIDLSITVTSISNTGVTIKVVSNTYLDIRNVIIHAFA